jgi:hypothetical protein
MRTKATQPLTRGPRPTSHTPWASVSVCEKGEPPREERTAVPLHLRRKQRTSLWHGGPGPRVILLGRRSPCAKKANHHARSEPPRLFISAESSGPASGTGGRAHESYSLGVGLRVRRRRTATQGANRRASSSPPKAADQPLTRGLGPMSHTPWASVSECEEGEPPREEQATARGSAPLHLRRNPQPSR